MKRFFTILFLLVFSTALFAREFYSLCEKEAHIQIRRGKEVYFLNARRIIKNSVTVTKEDTILIPEIDYKIDYEGGEIEFFENLSPGSQLEIRFKVFPQELLHSLYKYKNFGRIKRKKHKPVQMAEFSKKKDTFSSSELMISGSKSFSVSLGNKQDLNLDQSLSLQIDGKLSRKISVQAKLSDNNSPIAPEGTSKKVSELDKMFIKVYSGEYSILFGDFFIKKNDTYFANYDYKLEGVEFQSNIAYKPQVAATISNGDFMSYSFYGTEGIQGAYYLPGKNSSRVKVLSGTEKIYLDGKLMSRGNDYLINYNEGSITFKDKYIITENSYIIADYEYSSDDFKSNLYYGSGKLPFAGIDSKIFFSILTNNDDKNNPLNFSFSDQDKEILKQAGDDPILARKPGIDSVEVGEGNYVKVDSFFQYVALILREITLLIFLCRRGTRFIYKIRLL